MWSQAWTHHSLQCSGVLSNSGAIQVATRNLVVHFKPCQCTLIFNLHCILFLCGIVSVSASNIFYSLRFDSFRRREMSVIHRKHAPSPHWGTRGSKHQRRAIRSMLSFMNSSVSSLSVVLGQWLLVSSLPKSEASATTFPIFPQLFHFLG